MDVEQNLNKDELAEVILSMMDNYQKHGFMHEDSAEYYMEKLQEFQALLNKMQSEVE
jgi:hypothetical protein